MKFAENWKAYRGFLWPGSIITGRLVAHRVEKKMKITKRNDQPMEDPHTRSITIQDIHEAIRQSWVKRWISLFCTSPHYSNNHSFKEMWITPLNSASDIDPNYVYNAFFFPSLLLSVPYTSYLTERSLLYSNGSSRRNYRWYFRHLYYSWRSDVPVQEATPLEVAPEQPKSEPSAIPAPASVPVPEVKSIPLTIGEPKGNSCFHHNPSDNRKILLVARKGANLGQKQQRSCYWRCSWNSRSCISYRKCLSLVEVCYSTPSAEDEEG